MKITLKELQAIFSGSRDDHPSRKGVRLAPAVDKEGALPVPHGHNGLNIRQNINAFLTERLNSGESMEIEDIKKDSQYYEFISEKQERKETKQWLEQRKQFANTAPAKGA